MKNVAHSCDKPWTHRRGMTLIHMIIACVLLMIFITISAPVFVNVFKLFSDIRRQEEFIVRIDQVTSRLRQDVESSVAPSAISDDHKTLTLTLADGRKIRWSFDAQGTLTRTPLDANQNGEPNAPAQSWKTLSADLTFTADQTFVRLNHPESAPITFAPLPTLADAQMKGANP